MTTKPTILVLAEADDPQLSMLADLPHILVRKPADLGTAAGSPVVILAWSGPKRLLRDVFLSCTNVLWVHSRSSQSSCFSQCLQKRSQLARAKS